MVGVHGVVETGHVEVEGAGLWKERGVAGTNADDILTMLE